MFALLVNGVDSAGARTGARVVKFRCRGARFPVVAHFFSQNALAFATNTTKNKAREKPSKGNASQKHSVGGSLRF